MKNKIGCLVLVLPLISIGCVSSSRYKKLQADRDALNNKSSALQQQLASMDEELTALKVTNDLLNQEKQNLEIQTEQAKSQYDSMVNQLQAEVQQGQLTIRQYKNMLSVDLAEKIFFDSGRAKIKASGKSVLKKVGEILAKYTDKTIRVAGHTDNVPVSKSYQDVFPSNWELSVIRATNVVRFLQEQCQIPGERLLAVGRGEFSPIATNTTPEGRQQNRRIEILLMDQSAIDAMEQAPQEAPAPSPPPQENIVPPSSPPENIIIPE